MAPMTRSARLVTSAAATAVESLERSDDTATMDGQTVLAALTQEVLVAAAGLGVDTAAIVSEAGLDPAVLADPDGRVPLPSHFRMWELLSKQPIGLALGARLGIAGMGVVGYAMQHGATVGDALSFQRRCRALIHPDVVPAFERREDTEYARKGMASFAWLAVSLMFASCNDATQVDVVGRTNVPYALVR